LELTLRVAEGEPKDRAGLVRQARALALDFLDVA